MTKPIYAVGDLHGYRDQFEHVVDLIARDGGADEQVVFLGDYVDRGPDTRGLLDGLCAGLRAGRDWILLKGNHDRMFEWFLEDPPRHDPYLLVGHHWLHERIGGRETLASYGLGVTDEDRLFRLHERAIDHVPKEHAALLRGLSLYHETPDHIFVHAGLRPGVPLGQQDEEDLLWIRAEFHEHTGSYGKLVVHGHTPVGQPTHYGNRLNLDTGAGYGEPATTVVLEGPRAWALTPAGRVPLSPRTA